jgi:hypothetical protein
MSLYALFISKREETPHRGAVRGFSGDEQGRPARISNRIEAALFLTTTPPGLNHAQAAMR